MCIRSNTMLRYPQAYRLVYRPPTGPSGLACWLALPQVIAPDATPLVAVHGIRRGADLQATLFARRAAVQGRPVIAPIFDKENWLGYQQAVLCGRADLALLDLLLRLRREGVVRTEQIALFGFSGGAQFAHRFALLHPERVARLSIASPGWYTFPDAESYLYGLWPRPDHADEWSYRMVAGLDRFLAIPMRVTVGEKDCARDKNTRSGPAIDAQQGLHRRARAARWTRAVRQAAEELKVRPDIELHVLPNCGHDFETCVRRGGLDRIVLPEVPEPAACTGTCSPAERRACAHQQGRLEVVS
ncbi:alpha/beta fold hydrolase [Roseobacter sinensis]|uniref:Alpha/beta hydrolase n=1 Tax=Roseobacter sinensis TaxID=2931391 RepID=A0ABT3BDQ3_9RHOB|nr:alpha/beta hydrolase [Roseobacter sp. WL0113]MCV3271298.1 alpha/beta hydrolase [Roseobacter sp. WL0113]